MGKLSKLSGKVIVITILLLLLTFSLTSAQQKDVELKKKYAEFIGDWKFNLEGMGEIVINLYIENGAFWALPETETEPGEMEPVKDKEGIFVVYAGDGSVWNVEFMKDDKGKITKCRIANEDQGIDTIGDKIVKEAKVDKAALYKEIAGNYSFDMEGMGIIAVEFYIENGALYALAETASSPSELILVKGKVLDFIIEDPEEGTYNLTFIKDEKGKISKCKVVNEDMGINSTGSRIEK